MAQLLRKLLTAFILLSWIRLQGQPPMVEVQSFDYIWNGYHTTHGQYIILANDEHSKQIIQNSFAKAFEKYWHLTLAGLSLNVKPLSVFSITPKFKPSIKNKDPDKWYLFLQIFDDAKFEYRYDEHEELSNTLQVKCKLVNGNDSTILENSMAVDLYENQSPDDQMVIYKLPAYPSSFLQAFDSIATWIFQQAPQSPRSLFLQPACIFQPGKISERPIAVNIFHTNNNDTISTPDGHRMTLHPGAINYERTETKRNFGGNALSSTVTILTGLQTNKSRYYLYKADIPFEGTDPVYHCYVNYVEKQIKEVERVKNDEGYSTKSTDYVLLGRFIDPDKKSYITKSQDTLAIFSIGYKNADVEYSQMWDGRDSSTVTPIPEEWKIRNSGAISIEVSGSVGNATFLMKVENPAVKQFYLDGKLAAVFHGKNNAVKTDVYQQLLPEQVAIFTMLSMVPYAYFNKN